jgi:hypothetical protein
MAEHVVVLPVEFEWDPNVEHGVLTTNEEGETRLRLLAKIDDPDQRPIVLLWHGTVAARMEPPNDEARSGHRLYEAGLRDVHWVGEVRESELIAQFERQNRVHPRHSSQLFDGLRHWILPLKGSVVEVVAETGEIRRAKASVDR